MWLCCTRVSDGRPRGNARNPRAAFVCKYLVRRIRKWIKKYKSLTRRRWPRRAFRIHRTPSRPVGLWEHCELWGARAGTHTHALTHTTDHTTKFRRCVFIKIRPAYDVRVTRWQRSRSEDYGLRRRRRRRRTRDVVGRDKSRKTLRRFPTPPPLRRRRTAAAGPSPTTTKPPPRYTHTSGRFRDSNTQSPWRLWRNGLCAYSRKENNIYI